MDTEFITHIIQNTNTFDVIVTLVGGCILVMLKKWVRPMWVELTKGESRIRNSDTKFTVKDLLIENYRAMERIHARQDASDKTQAEMFAAVGELRGSVKTLNDILQAHLTEANSYKPLFEDMKKHLEDNERHV